MSDHDQTRRLMPTEIEIDVWRREAIELLGAHHWLWQEALRFVRRAAAGNLVAHLSRQRAWSQRTFGPGDRTHGVIDHIRKELGEVHADHEAGRATLPEWIDVVILALDGAWRSGATPEQIVEALIAKQEKNEARSWPDWRTADPDKAIEHDRAKERP